MCIGTNAVQPVTQPTPSTNYDTSQWTPTAIEQFLVKYPTQAKADGFSGPNPGKDTPSALWATVANTPTGRTFLAQHAANRAAAGDTSEANAITSFLQSTNPTQVTSLPTLPAPAPSNPASSVTRADIPVLNRANYNGTANDLTIPLLKATDPTRLPTLPTLSN